MGKPRPLRRIIQDLGKLHGNRRFDTQLHGVIVRVPFVSESFTCLVPDLPEDYRFVTCPKVLDLNRSYIPSATQCRCLPTIAPNISVNPMAY